MAAPSVRDNELQDNVHDGERDLSYRGTRIQTLADLLVYAQVDTRIWEVERHVINKYEVAAKTPEGMTTSMLFQIKAWLRRKITEEKLQNLMQGILEQFRQAAPIQPPILHRAGPKGLLEISIMDHHLGKYCSQLETGRAYDPEISERMFIIALEDLLSKSASLPAEKILFVCGNDFLNTDHLGRTTTAGTPQDEAIRYQESFLRGRQLLDACRTAEVRVPDDVAVIGVDNDEVLCDLSDPPLSSVVPVVHRHWRGSSDIAVRDQSGELDEGDRWLS